MNETEGGRVMGPQRSAAVMAALCGTFVLAGWGAAGLVSLVLPGIEHGGAPIALSTPQATAMAEEGVSVPATGRVAAAFADLGTMLPPAAPSVSLSTPDPAPNDVAATAPAFVVTETGNSGAASPDPAPNDLVAATLPTETAEPGRLGTVLPDPAPMLSEAPPARITPAHTSDPAPSDVAAATLPAEFSEPGSLGAASPDAAPMLSEAPPVRIAPAPTPDPVPNDIAAATFPEKSPSWRASVPPHPTQVRCRRPPCHRSRSCRRARPIRCQTMSRLQRFPLKSPSWRASTPPCPILIRCRPPRHGSK